MQQERIQTYGCRGDGCRSAHTDSVRRRRIWASITDAKPAATKVIHDEPVAAIEAAEPVGTDAAADAAQGESDTADLDAAAETFRQCIAESGIAGVDALTQQSGAVPVASTPLSQAVNDVLSYLRSRAPTGTVPSGLASSLDGHSLRRGAVAL
jgi:hypothetical protein